MRSQVLDRFKAGEGNVLVATSIGEEGLDIGEIDMVICYDAQKTPIRMVWTSRRLFEILTNELSASTNRAYWS
jgi:ERCC4-related helicase